MKKRNAISLIFMLIIVAVLSFAAPAFADDTYTVTFYTNAEMKDVLETQKVSKGEHPSVPKKIPEGYEDGDYRYEFDKWYWIVDGAALEFTFDSDDCEIWGDADIYAGYAQYLKKGKELVVISEDGTDFITDTDTPVTKLLNEYYGVENVYVQDEGDYVTGEDSISDKPTSLHNKAVIVLGLITVLLGAIVIAIVIKIRKKESA